jgi:hypothetical protein
MDRSPSDPEKAPTVELYWIPLGAGGHSVKYNGRAYEALVAAAEHRTRAALYHAALVLHLDGASYAVELEPERAGDPEARGVVLTGPVGSRHLARLRACRYELRCEPDGTIPDVAEAVASPLILSWDPDAARRVLQAAPELPRLVWGRDELGAGEMWNSNSAISWLLVQARIDPDVAVPPGGRAPGWSAGIAAARDRNVQRRT